MNDRINAHPALPYHACPPPSSGGDWRASQIPDSGPVRSVPEWRGMNARAAQEVHG
jgi:hypothetical protein